MEQRYFIAIIPPPSIANEITEIKKEFTIKYQSKAALRSPAHITLHMPFLWREEKEEKLIDTLQAFSFSTNNCNINLKAFGKFGDRVIFIKVEKNGQLVDLQKNLVDYCKLNLLLFNQTDDLRGFHPHITVAFRDLRKKYFVEAWNEFNNRTFDASFNLDAFSLLKHDGKQWNVLHNFNLI